MPDEEFLDIDIVTVQGDRAHDMWVKRLREALYDYQCEHGAIAYDQLDIKETKHPVAAGVRMMMIIRRQGTRSAPIPAKTHASHDSPQSSRPLSGGGKKKGEKNG